jgi:hypothetical protein
MFCYWWAGYGFKRITLWNWGDKGMAKQSALCCNSNYVKQTDESMAMQENVGKRLNFMNSCTSPMILNRMVNPRVGTGGLWRTTILPQLQIMLVKQTGIMKP